MPPLCIRSAARMILRQGLRDSATAVLKVLHRLPIRACIEYKLCLLARYIRELFQPVKDFDSPSSHLRSALNGVNKVKNWRTSVFCLGSTGLESSSGGTDNDGRHGEIQERTENSHVLKIFIIKISKLLLFAVFCIYYLFDN